MLFPGMGVQFTAIDDQARHELTQLVEALTRSRKAA